jgi:hypothetical protein
LTDGLQIYFEFFLRFASERCTKIQVLTDEFNTRKTTFLADI